MNRLSQAAQLNKELSHMLPVEALANIKTNTREENFNKDNIRAQAVRKTQEIIDELEKYTGQLFESYAGRLDATYNRQMFARLETLCSVTDLSAQKINEAFAGDEKVGRQILERISQKVLSTLSMSSDELMKTATFKQGDVYKVRRSNGQVEGGWEVLDPNIDQNGEVLMCNYDIEKQRPCSVVELRKINPEY